MTFKQLEVFLAVVREASFSRAAARIHLSQPTCSEHVAQLEEELGSALVARRGRRVGLTEAGRVFVDYAARVVATVAGARQAIEEVRGLGRGSLLIGASTTPGTYLLPRLCAAFGARYPGISLSLEIANSRTIEERIRDDLDLGVVGGHILDPDEPCVAAGVVDELLLIVPAGHPYAIRGTIAGAQLAREPLLMREEGSATRQVTERGLREAGIPFIAGMQLGHTEAIKQAVMAGLGIAFVSVHAIRGELETKRLQAVRVRGLRLRRHFHVIHDERRPLSASAQAFADLLTTSARPRPPLTVRP
jgi:DNA-binding transcriptional LysR family regulator